MEAPEPATSVLISPRVRVSVGSDSIVVPETLLEHRRVEHSCGVYGVWTATEGASRLAFFALYALNHRGQESAGIASFSTAGIQVHKGMGLVSQVFDEASITALTGKHAIGHTRYSTSGGSQLAGAQPFVLETDLGQLAIAHNGQVSFESRYTFLSLPCLSLHPFVTLINYFVCSLQIQYNLYTRWPARLRFGPLFSSGELACSPTVTAKS